MAAFGTFVAGQVLTAAELNGAADWTSFTPSLTQSATVTKTVSYAKYWRLGKMIVAQCQLEVTGSGTASNEILVGLPVTAASSGYIVGIAAIWNGSGLDGSTQYAVLNDTGTICFDSINSSTKPPAGLTSPTLASGMTIWYSIMYEAAAYS